MLLPWVEKSTNFGRARAGVRKREGEHNFLSLCCIRMNPEDDHTRLNKNNLYKSFWEQGSKLKFPFPPLHFAYLPSQKENPRVALTSIRGQTEPPPPSDLRSFLSMWPIFSFSPPPPHFSVSLPFPPCGGSHHQGLSSSSLGGSTARTMLRSGFPPPCGNSLPPPSPVTTAALLRAAGAEEGGGRKMSGGRDIQQTFGQEFLREGRTGDKSC